MEGWGCDDERLDDWGCDDERLDEWGCDSERLDGWRLLIKSRYEIECDDRRCLASDSLELNPLILEEHDISDRAKG